jgi:hypothetical protein
MGTDKFQGMLTGLVDIYIDSADGTVAEHVQSPLAGVFFSRSSHPLYHVVIDHNAVAGIMFGVDREQRQGINVYGCIATIECIKVIFGFRALVSELHIGHILGSFSQLNTIVLVSQSLDSSDFYTAIFHFPVELTGIDGNTSVVFYIHSSQFLNCGVCRIEDRNEYFLCLITESQLDDTYNIVTLRYLVPIYGYCDSVL